MFLHILGTCGVVFATGMSFVMVYLMEESFDSVVCKTYIRILHWECRIYIYYRNINLENMILNIPWLDKATH